MFNLIDCTKYFREILNKLIGCAEIIGVGRAMKSEGFTLE